MVELGNYLWGVVSEGLFIALIFWLIVLITIERSSLWGAAQAGLIAEAVGNLPYLFGEEALGPVGLLMTLVAGVVFVKAIVRIGELSTLKATYGILTTYFLMVAVVSCGAV